jgi:hypothetical protein
MNENDPKLTVSDQVKLIARDETNKLLLAHLRLCPFVSNKVEERTRSVETKLARAYGFMAGSGLLGGFSGGMIAKLIN